MITIRPYQPSDKENVRRVCMHLAPEEPTPALLGPAHSPGLSTFCDYYIECEPQNCFVADDGGTAVGCIWCAEEYRRYYRRFKKDYLANMSLRKRVNYWGAARMPVFFAKKYPAHLHIDVLNAYQRQGLGFQLMDALTTHLRGKGVPGVMLVVGESNEKGRNFYRKYGFRQIARLGGIVLGLDLREG